MPMDREQEICAQIRRVDARKDLDLRRTAIALVSQLPDDNDEANRVLDHARELIATFLRDPAERATPGANVVTMARKEDRR